MSAVVLRCSHCGTVQPEPGECEACHEAEVRYFCTNHSPGVWLDTDACPQCGARFGQAAAPPPPRARVPDDALLEPASPAPDRIGERGGPGPWAERPTVRPRRMEDDDYPVPDPTRALFEIISAAATRARPPRGGSEGAPAHRGCGCFGALFLLALLMLGLFTLLPVLLGTFFVYW